MQLEVVVLAHACSCRHLRYWCLHEHGNWTLIFKLIAYCLVNFDLDLDLNVFP